MTILRQALDKLQLSSLHPTAARTATGSGTGIDMQTRDGDLYLVLDSAAGTGTTPLGYSVGRFDGETLVVTTTNISWPHFNQAGIPQSSQSVITEHFTSTEDGSVLAYAMTVTDPVNFTRPVELSKKMLYIPSETLLPFGCAE